MNLTQAFRKWLTANCGVKTGAADSEYRKAAGLALANGDLTTEKFLELTKPEEEPAVAEFTKQFAQMGQRLNTISLTLEKITGQKATASGETETETETETRPAGKKAGPSWMEKMVSRIGAGEDDEGNPRIHVKGAWEQYNDTKSALSYGSHTKAGRAHPFAGQPVMDQGRVVHKNSELGLAVCGAYSQFMCATAQKGGSRTFGFQSLPQHSKELLYYAMEEMEWGGASDGGDFADIKGRKLSPREQKALIDDATSGGLEAAPIVFDDQIIQAPLLNGELYPLVNTVPLDRGRRVEGVSTGTVTGGWGGVDDTDISLFNTASYVSAFDTTIFRWEGAVRIGLDFLSDTPIDFGQHITAQYGERLLEDLDDVIAVGNGTTQPEGITNKSGTTSVNFGGTTTIGGYESLRFGVTKQEHKPNLIGTAVFCGTETSYQRAMAIPVGASDARRLSQTQNLPNYDGYSWIGRPYKINGSLANTQIFYAILGRYRMYRRRGLTIRTSQEGDTLIRKNEMLISVTARYGGQLERGACAAVTSTAPA